MRGNDMSLYEKMKSEAVDKYVPNQDTTRLYAKMSHSTYDKLQKELQPDKANEYTTALVLSSKHGDQFILLITVDDSVNDDEFVFEQWTFKKKEIEQFSFKKRKNG